MPNTAWLTQSASAIAQSSALGFHLMKVGSWNQIVAPPSTAIRPNVTQSMVSTLRRISSRMPICTIVATMTTTVASSTGASSTPTTPPETAKPRCSVA